jgi:2-polyprenyl-6-hydroxyphenyl methylase/3-demethylubiquinone-9 3-methyltransferase
MTDLTKRNAHFDFGANWISFIKGISDAQVAEAVRSMKRLFPDGELRGKSFLDIGSGSGLSMLAALKLGANEAIGIDLDEHSVEAARSCLTRFAPEDTWAVSRASVFDLTPELFKRFDVVHSWGVLHHTGDMWSALERAAAMVVSDGFLAIAVYRKTASCNFWRKEKYVYSHMPMVVQAPIRWLYQAAFLTGKIGLLQNPFTHLGAYRQKRGMSWTHDVHDWLGGYPYESATPEEVRKKFSALGFRMVREKISPTRAAGLFGSGCSEYIARR